MSSTQHAGLTDSKTSKAESTKETHPNSLTFRGCLLRKKLLDVDNRAVSLFEYSYCWD